MENSVPKFTLTLDLNQINIILAGLGKMPFETVADLVNDLRNQALKQMPASPAVEPEKQDE